MTAFATSQLPTGTRAITTLEELIVWAGQALAVVNPTAKFVRTVGNTSEQKATFGDFQDANGIFQIQIVSILEVDPSKIGQSLPDWKIVKEVSTTALLTSFSG
ncbi:MAG: hypothetical protein NW214_08620 [Pseudanabaenaceae cyanobacterium bins.39]|nr:hypothetical protein [Pseudanabaenaceae cyanobacterium bins.39]